MVEHVDPEVLALAALGEPIADDADRRHLAGCSRCADEISSLSVVVASGRSAAASGLLVAPSAVVWDRIRAELELSEGLDPEGGRVPVRSGAERFGGERTGAAGLRAEDADSEETGVDGAEWLADEQSDAEASDEEHSEQSDADPLDDERSYLPARAAAPVVELRRRRTPWIAAAAAAAGLLIGGAGGAWWVGNDSKEPPRPAVVARAALDPLPGWKANGTALVEKQPDGSRVLVVTLDGGLKTGDFREVWLLDRSVKHLVSLGILQGAEGRFTVPDGLDLADLAVVDVSEEPFDGNPLHSGDSVVRGTLRA